MSTRIWHHQCMCLVLLLNPFFKSKLFTHENVCVCRMNLKIGLAECNLFIEESLLNVEASVVKSRDKSECGNTTDKYMNTLHWHVQRNSRRTSSIQKVLSISKHCKP